MKVQSVIESSLKEAFDVELLRVENESHRHSVPPNSETHFKVTLVSSGFEGQSKVKRHQAIYKVLAKELAERVHALSLHLYSVKEWAESGQPVPESPDCMGGSKNDPEMAARLGQGESL
jgi:BolA protein